MIALGKGFSKLNQEIFPGLYLFVWKLCMCELQCKWCSPLLTTLPFLSLSLSLMFWVVSRNRTCALPVSARLAIHQVSCIQRKTIRTSLQAGVPTCFSFGVRYSYCFIVVSMQFTSLYGWVVAFFLIVQLREA